MDRICDARNLNQHPNQNQQLIFKQLKLAKLELFINNVATAVCAILLVEMISVIDADQGSMLELELVSPGLLVLHLKHALVNRCQSFEFDAFLLAEPSDSQSFLAVTIQESHHLHILGIVPLSLTHHFPHLFVSEVKCWVKIFERIFRHE